MRVTTPRTADSPAIGPGSLTRGFFCITMAPRKLQKPITHLKSTTHFPSQVNVGALTSKHFCDKNSDVFCYIKPSLVYCHDINALMNKLKLNVYKDEEWRLFIDSSKRSLKAVLLNNTNALPLY